MRRSAYSSAGRLGAIVVCALVAWGCASRDMTLELHTSILYDKPGVSGISYTVRDARGDGGTVSVQVTVQGDPGLEATYDISPGIVDRGRMQETTDGTYVARFDFPAGVTGGPFTIIGRLKHDLAGEVALNARDPLTISLPR